MAEDDFWSFFWEMRLAPLENLGKQAAILSISRLIRTLAERDNHPLSLLELGCGEGQVIGQLLDAHASLCSSQASAGVDYSPQSLAVCRKTYPAVRWVEGDFTDPDLLARLGKFDIVILVNALHEVFSDSLSSELNKMDIQAAKTQVKRALALAAGCLVPQGWLVLFDGLEPPGDPHRMVRIRFQDYQSREGFEEFAAQFQPFIITYQDGDDPWCVELSQRDFTRYITKSIFLGKHLWESERLQSYQYFTEGEYRQALESLGFVITELTLLTMNEEKWRQLVDIEPYGERFPDEHILILASRQPNGER